MAIVEATIGGGAIFSNVLGVKVSNAAMKFNPPVIMLSRKDWTNQMPLEVNVYADTAGTPVKAQVLVEVAADGAFKNVIASALTTESKVSLGYVKAANVYIRARYAGSY